MNDVLAKRIFEEIQARPYNIGLTPQDRPHNCYFKGIELLQRLGILGYTVRGRVGETYWDEAIFGREITDLLSADILTTHFFVEIYQNDTWRALDPSFQPQLSKYGLTIGTWENGKHCFPITKLYTQEESIAYQEKWFNPQLQQDFFKRGGPTWSALQKWFAERV